MTTSAERTADTVILRAADLAEEAAEACHSEGRWQIEVRDCDVHIDGGTHVALMGRQSWPGVWEDARLIAASGPDHWRDLAATLRAQVKWHHPRTGHCSICAQFIAPCSGLTSLLPLANGIISKLTPTDTTQAAP